MVNPPSPFVNSSLKADFVVTPKPSAGIVTLFSPLAGLMLCGLLAAVSMQLERLSWLAAHGIGALTIAIMLGIAVGNLISQRVMRGASSGVLMSKQHLLRTGIVLYGLRITFHDISGVGIAGIGIDLLTLSSTFLLCSWIGTRFFGLDRVTAMLIGTGSSICGAAAVIAAAPVLKARAEQVAIAVATVVVFGTAATFLYPFLFEMAERVAPGLVSGHDYGLFVGSTIHEVAQVVAAGRSVSAEAANTAVIEKMVRVMLLAPFLIALSAWLSRSNQGQQKLATDRGNVCKAIPWFAVLFIVVAGINSLFALPLLALLALGHLDTVLLAMAMAALGLTTHRAALRIAGVKPLLLGGLVFAWLVIGGGIINLVVRQVL